MTDLNSFESDVMAWTGRLRSRARGLVRNRDAADDLVHDTVVRALRSRDQFRPGTNIGSWLYTILRNVYLSDLRKSRLRNFSDMSDDPPVVGPGNAEVITWTREMREALDRLPAEQRRAVLLAAAGYSYDEIAAFERCLVGTVKSRVSRGRQTLRDALGGV